MDSYGFPSSEAIGYPAVRKRGIGAVVPHHMQLWVLKVLMDTENQVRNVIRETLQQNKILHEIRKMFAEIAEEKDDSTIASTGSSRAGSWVHEETLSTIKVAEFLCC